MCPSAFPSSYSVHSNLVMNDEEGIIPEVKLFRAAGGRTICDVTSIGFRINPEALPRVSKATGVNIVAGTAFYLDSFLSEEHKMMSVREVSPACIGSCSGVSSRQVHIIKKGL